MKDFTSILNIILVITVVVLIQLIMANRTAIVQLANNHYDLFEHVTGEDVDTLPYYK